MSKVSIVSSQVFKGEEGEIFEIFKKFLDAIISKDKKAMETYLGNSFHLIHMSGKKEPKEEFINDVMNGVLNYFSSKIIEPKIEVINNSAKMIADVNLDAKVYGMKGNWTLHSKNYFEKINNIWQFIKWDN